MQNTQLSLPLPLPPIPSDAPLVPARMVNEYVYCRRLGYLMWRQGEWADTSDTVDGRRVHQRVDSREGNLPAPDELHLQTESERLISKSLTLSSDKLGVIAKIDVAESAGGIVTPIDYKRGKRPHVPKGVYEPERVQVCLQAMLLEENGYRVDEGAIYYAQSRERVRVQLDDFLRSTALRSVHEFRLAVAQGRIPEPLSESPKCPRCALVTICLPDETRALRGARLEPRPISIGLDESLPLVVQSQFAKITKDGNVLKISDEKQGDRLVRIDEVSDVALFGNVNMSTPALTTLLDRNIPVTFHSYGGWLRGIARGLDHRNVDIRIEQYRKSFDAEFCKQFAQDLVMAKIMNQRTMVRRNWKGDHEERRKVLGRLKAARRNASRTLNMDKLRGIEGDAAKTYFRAFAKMLNPPANDGDGSAHHTLPPFQFESRNRRPPTDPVNALLSLAYSMLTRHLTISLAGIGLDPFRGYFHSSKHGKPALALDLMEPFRPIIADSVVLSSVNSRVVSESSFITATTGTQLTDTGRKHFIAAIERRLAQETTHALFGYKLSMRRLIILQSRLLTRLLLGELKQYPHYTPR